jgi:hypothetical protein
MVIACPACGGVYRFRKQVDGSGTRVSCPDCQIEFVMLPSQLEVTGERSVITLPDPGISITLEGERISAPMEVPFDDEPSDAEVLSATAVGEFASSRAATDPPAPDRIRRLEQELFPSGEHRPLDHPSIEPDAELIRLRNNQGVDAATLARRLLDEERMVPQERFVPVGDQVSPVRWMVAGAVFMALIVVCATIGAVAGGATDRGYREAPKLGHVISTATPVSAAVAAPLVVEEDEEEPIAAVPPAAPVVEEPPPEVVEEAPEILQAR